MVRYRFYLGTMKQIFLAILALLSTHFTSPNAEAALNARQVSRKIRSCEWQLVEHNLNFRNLSLATHFTVVKNRIEISSSEIPGRKENSEGAVQIRSVKSSAGPSGLPIVEFTLIEGSDEETSTIVITLTFIQDDAENFEPVLISAVKLFNDGPNELSSADAIPVSVYYRPRDKDGKLGEAKKLLKL
jgi:hypothetical protein